MLSKTVDNNETTDILEQINQIADQLCLSVKGVFDFSLVCQSNHEAIQKLCLLINFVLDSARRSLQDLDEKNKKLTELDHLKSDFIANISHELRTPLTLLSGPLELILKDQSLPPHHVENLKRIKRNAARLYLLVNDLLDFFKIDAGCFNIHNELIDLDQLITELVDDAQVLAKENQINLTYKGTKNLGPKLLDKKIIEKIILNLLSNALKFTPKGGNIEVTLKEHKKILELTVKDTGIGIEETHLNHIFERFYQIDSSSNHTHTGTGIGLALVKQFIELINGAISVTSELGKGSSFTIKIPQEKLTLDTYSQIVNNLSSSLRRLSKDVSAPIREEDNPSKNKKPLILIAEDNADMRAFMQVILEDRFDVILVENGQQALETIPTHEPQVILTDAMMPQMDGYQLTKAIKSNPKTRHIPVILVTAKSGNDAVISGLDVGANDYLSKPFLPEELIARIQASLRTYYDYVALNQVNLKLEQEIEERKKLEYINNELHSQLVFAARQAGMADIATSVLHNIGNVLNSANISTTIINHCISQSKISDLDKVAALLEENKEHIGDYLSNDEKGKYLIQYLGVLATVWKKDHEKLDKEIHLLRNNIDHIKNIITQQQALGSAIGFNEKTSIPELMEHCIALNVNTHKKIDIIREYEPIKQVIIDKVKLMQIVVNLIKNSVDSLHDIKKKNADKIITVRTFEKNSSTFAIQINDNGIGINNDNLDKIFTHGFTTKKYGHGFGLHASAVSAQEMGGSLSVESDGQGKGATFTLSLPYRPVKGR